MIRAEHFFLSLFAPARAKMQDCAFIALFAPILLLTLSIMPVLHAVTEAATTNDYFLASSPYDNSHLSISHYHFFLPLKARHEKIVQSHSRIAHNNWRKLRAFRCPCASDER
jgi:hypothetical protein